MDAVIDALLVGAVQALDDTGHLSGIAKLPVRRALQLGVNGFEGDGQADIRHGGPDKAVHHYAIEHYAHWIEAIGPESVLVMPGAFGENLSTRGMTEETVCIGDIYRLGTAVVEVSQTRQPCWKLNARFRRSDMSLRVQRSGKTGWYYRVLETGLVAPGDTMRLLERPHAAWPLSHILEALYHRTADEEMLARLAVLTALPPRWRELCARRLSTGQLEDWSERLNGG
jgi:MOSC domain-containing protein YiiM